MKVVADMSFSCFLSRCSASFHNFSRIKQLVRDAAREISSEIPPSGPEQQEAYFQEQVAEGEKLAALGECYSGVISARYRSETAVEVWSQDRGKHGRGIDNGMN